MSQYQQITIEDIELDLMGNVTIVQFREPRITDLLEIEQLGRELYQLIEEPVHRKLVLDFSEVMFFSSAAIGKLISLSGKLRALSGILKLCNLRPEVLDVLRVCKLDTVFDIRQDRNDAMLSFGS